MNRKQRRKTLWMITGSHVWLITGLLIFITGCSIETTPEQTIVKPQTGPPDKYTVTSDSYWDYQTCYGDFDGDNLQDKVTGEFKRMIDGIEEAGAVYIEYGDHYLHTQLYHQNTIDVYGVCEEDDWFGFSVAAGDFNGDTYDDLAVGVVGESVVSIEDTGCVNIFYGSPTGLTVANNHVIHQGVPGIYNTCEYGDAFGFGLATGRFNDDSYDDLCVGVPYEGTDDCYSHGTIHTIMGSATGLTVEGTREWRLRNENFQSGTYFGKKIDCGDLNGDGYDDLVLGTQHITINDFENAGAIFVMFSSATGFSYTRVTRITAAFPGIDRPDDQFMFFGQNFTVDNFNGSGSPDDLVISNLFYPVQGYPCAGEFYILYGVPGVGFDEEHTHAVNRATSGIPGDPEMYQYFGSNILAADYNDDGYTDLEIFQGLVFEHDALILNGGPNGLLP